MSQIAKKTLKRYYDRSVSLLWVLFILLLPLTSSPLVVKLIGGQMVALPSGIIVLVIMIVWTVPKIAQGMTIPKHTLPIFLFFFIALVSVLIGYWRDIPAFKGINPIKENIESLITVVVGISYYLVTLLWLREKNDAKEFLWTLRLITFAGMLILTKAFAEVALWKIYGRYPLWFREIHNLFVTGPLFRARAAAFAYEPSWLANQLNLLFLPYWLASAVTRFTAFKRKLWKIHVEDICLMGGMFVLFFTLSRLGYISFLLMLGIIFLRGTAFFVNGFQKKIQEKDPKFKEKRAKILLRIVIYAGVVFFYLLILLSAAFALAKLDFRNEELFNLNLKSFNFMKYAEELAFGARITYWWGGWNIFNAYPLLGVGLGNAGFYFPDMLPAYAWRLPEIQKLFFHTNIALNVKSLWFRILAETGIAGFSAFISFMIVLLSMTLSLKKGKNRFARTIGWMGLFTFATFFIEELSLDSFALPYFWISFGITAAGYEYEFRQGGESES
ncbi:MAG: O-antigen ligase family protein [Anaerolineaceae bacterium]|nr:O-antigen ligase family protein [Anaerolineaceae bacterium]